LTDSERPDQSANKTISSTADAISFSHYQAMDDVLPLWRKFEDAGHVTPYQRAAWIKALLANGAERGNRLSFVVVTEAGKEVALLPLAISQRIGLTQAHIIGAELSNSDAFVATTDFSPSPDTLIKLLRDIGQALNIDVLRLSNIAPLWDGRANPLMGLPHRQAPSHFYLTEFADTPQPYIDHRLTTKRRNNVRRGRRRIEEEFGPLRFVAVDTADELKRVHAIFLDQRGQRFDAMGIANVFAEPPFPGLFLDLTEAEFGKPRPAMSVHALYCGDEILATSWGATAGDHYSQYINSTSSGPAARYSLMSLLMADLMDDLISRGFRSLDLGTGDFEYKLEWTEKLPVYNALLAITAKGKLAAQSAEWADAAKRTVKQTPALWSAAKALRRALHRLRR
jgi:CelD/BcsL family acetyltransferase involved in cellulose biosynthesis